MNIHSLAVPSPVSQRDPGDRAEAILDAALGLFASQGYHGTTVPEVAQRAKLAAGTLYRYFDSKEALVNALFRREKRRFMLALLDGVAVDAPHREQFRALWFRLARFYEEHPQSTQFLELHLHGPYLDDESRALELQSLEPVVLYVQSAQAQQVIKPLDPKAVIALVYGAFLGLTKAQMAGQLVLTPALLAQAEACAWEAVRR